MLQLMARVSRTFNLSKSVKYGFEGQETISFFFEEHVPESFEHDRGNLYTDCVNYFLLIDMYSLEYRIAIGIKR